MNNTVQIHIILFSIVFLLFFTCNMGYAQLAVELLVEPNIQTIPLDVPQRIVIAARPSQDNVQFVWALNGPGELSKEATHPWIFYIPPETITEASVQATVTVIVTNPEGTTATNSLTFTLQASQLTTAILTVRSNVREDTVFIDGEKYDPTRLDQELPVGKHTIRVEKDGCTPHEETIDLQEDMTVRATLACATPTPKVHLRTQPMIVSDNGFKSIFGLDENRRPREYITNDFEDRGEVIVDRATGLMWQKSGSERLLTYEYAQTYIDSLNHERFAGYDDWRLPTISELLSLVEPEKQSNELYIHPTFNKTQKWCWSADTRLSEGASSDSAWYVNFWYGCVSGTLTSNNVSVRAVRSL